MAQAGKGIGTEPSRHKTKLSRDRKEASGKSPDSDPPKLSHKSRKTLTADHKELLKKAFDDLCCPQTDGESRLSEWLEVNARKDKDIRNKEIKNWVDKYASNFPNLKRFNASHFLQGLQAQDFKPEVAIQYTNSLLVRQTAFNSIESFEAAQAVIKRIRKGDVQGPDQLLGSVSELGNRQLKPENLQKAINDVGLKSPVIKGLLNVAMNVMDTDLDQESFAHEVEGLKLVLKRLEKQTKSGNANRFSAPTGTISLDDLAKQARNLPIASGLERQGSGEKSPAESPVTTPRKDVHRENKSVGKGKSKSRSDLNSELSPEGNRKKEVKRDESPTKKKRDDSPTRKRLDASKAQPGGSYNETGGTTLTASTTITTSPAASNRAGDTGSSPQPGAGIANPFGRPEPLPRPGPVQYSATGPSSGKQGDGGGADSAGNASAMIKSGHRRQPSGQSPAVMAELKHKLRD